MSFFSRLLVGAAPEIPTRKVPSVRPPEVANSGPSVVRNSGQETNGNGHASRSSNGLKEFLWLLDGIGRGQLLDLGPAWQTTLMFFIERKFKVYTEDLLTGWSQFVARESNTSRALLAEAVSGSLSANSRTERFLEETLTYPEGSFDAVLLWDSLDYVDRDVATRLIERLMGLMREGGVVLAMFHAQPPEQFNRYQVTDPLHLELVSAKAPLPAQRVYQNREISNLFRQFRSSKTFVGRDQLREIVLIK
jgi:hypothetical protein